VQEAVAQEPPEPSKLSRAVTAVRVKASPLARKIAAQSGVDLKLIQGSGPEERIVRRDVEAASTAPAAARGCLSPVLRSG